MIFDTHSHIYFDTIKDREALVIEKMKEFGVEYSAQIGCDIESSKKAISLAKKYPFFFATVGFHPTDGQSFDSIATMLVAIQDLDRLIGENRGYIVAIGETGLDYFHLEEGKEEDQKNYQKELFRLQADLGKKHNLPLVIHTRNAPHDTISLIKEFHIKNCVIHCFSEDFAFAQELMEYSENIYFSFSGIVTYKSAIAVQEAASKIPLDRILVETDAPFLSPQPVRGQINEPAHTKYVLEKIQELRSEDPGLIEDTIFKNSLRFYGLESRIISSR